MAEDLGDRWIGEIVGRDVDRLDRGDRRPATEAMRSSNSAISLANVGW